MTEAPSIAEYRGDLAMSVCHIQLNSPNTIQGVNLLPGTYTGEESAIIPAYSPCRYA